jgi:DUF971 family protein
MGLPPDADAVRETVDESINLDRVDAVGGYALQFAWSDGHSSGIYTWEYLRLACPCAECLTV